MTFGEPPDELLRFLADAPVDDERESEEERAAIDEVKADRAAGVATTPFDAVKRRFMQP